MKTKELDSLIEGVVNNRVRTKTASILGLIEEALDNVYEQVVMEKESSAPVSAKRSRAKEFLLTLPKFSPNESWGDPGSVDRQTVNKIFSVVGGGATIEEKLKFIQKIADPASRITSPRRIISTLIILESLSAAINSFSASAAGFVFEGFLAALLRGRQEAEISDKGNLPIQDLIGFSEIGGNTPISLKLLNQTTNIHGSYTNLVDALDEFGEMIYVIARKDGDQIALEEFTLTRDNFIDAISTSARGSRTKEADLFYLSGQRAKSIRYLNSLTSWPEKFAALQKTQGYRGKSREPTDLSSQADEEGAPKASSTKGKQSSDHPAASLGFTPDELERYGLNESSYGGAQWSISGPQLKSLRGVNYKLLGELPYSSARIEKIAEMHMDKLNGSLMELFEATKALSDNINNYFTYEERDKAIKSGETAIKDTEKIQDSLKTEISGKD